VMTGMPGEEQDKAFGSWWYVSSLASFASPASPASLASLVHTVATLAFLPILHPLFTLLPLLPLLHPLFTQTLHVSEHYYNTIVTLRRYALDPTHVCFYRPKTMLYVAGEATLCSIFLIGMHE
jgi:hypothetical protein